MNLAKIERDNDCVYMLQDISGLQGYDRAKAIVNFCDKETKIFEREIDRTILDIFEKNNIAVKDTKNDTLKRAFEKLGLLGKKIIVEDIYKNVSLYQCEKIKENKLFAIWLEDKSYLQMGVSIKEERK